MVGPAASPLRRVFLALLAGAVLAAGIIVGLQPSSSRPQATARGAQPRSSRPNIVFILTDDLSLNLVRFMPHVRALQRQGMTFNDYFVSDSLCCPSRSSIFTGNFPHDTGVFSNGGPQGGFHVFLNRGEQRHTFALALRRAGYRTALMGKYLNGYMAPASGRLGTSATYEPPGWSEWDVGGNGYPEFNYALNENGTLHAYGSQPSDYLTDVLARRAVAFVGASAPSGNPFLLEVATFAPHGPYVPAPRNANDFPGLGAPRPPSFNVLPTNAPLWLTAHPPLTNGQIAQIDTVFRLRAQDVEAVDELIGQIQRALAANGIADRTYFVFSSDNGLHTGEYRLAPGKMTAFDTDIHVPLVVAGPGVPAGASTNAMTENIDLAKTFAAIGGATLSGDGHNLLALLRGRSSEHWGDAVLVEHHGPDVNRADPDFQQPPSGNPTTYEAMRSHQFLYVEYNSGEREFYDLGRDPFELHNIAAGLTGRDLAHLHAALYRLELCHTGAACWAARHVATDRVGPRRRIIGRG